MGKWQKVLVDVLEIIIDELEEMESVKRLEGPKKIEEKEELV